MSGGVAMDETRPYLELVPLIKTMNPAMKNQEIHNHWDRVIELIEDLNHEINPRKESMKGKWNDYNLLSKLLAQILFFIEQKGRTSFSLAMFFMLTDKQIFRIVTNLHNFTYPDHIIQLLKTLHKNLLLLKDLYGLEFQTDERSIDEQRKEIEAYFVETEEWDNYLKQHMPDLTQEERNEMDLLRSAVREGMNSLADSLNMNQQEFLKSAHQEYLKVLDLSAIMEQEYRKHEAKEAPLYQAYLKEL